LLLLESDPRRLNFNLSCAARLLERERQQARVRAEERWELARAAAQMVAAMMWCKHGAADREQAEGGGTRCAACGARFRSSQSPPLAAGGQGPFKPQTVKVRRNQ
jgi:hypothetical protein